MADFPTTKNLALTLDGTIQTLGITYKEEFFILNPPSNSNNVSIYAGDNEIKIWELAPGDSWQVSAASATINNSLTAEIPLKVQGTNTELLLGFIG